MSNHEIDQNFNYRQYTENLENYNDTNQDTHIGGGNADSRVGKVVEFLPEGSKVLEVGAGAGDDALALRSKGYEVLATDYVEGFVDIMAKKGLDAVNFDATKDPIPAGFNAIYANAVFVHFSPEQTKAFLKRAKQSLEGSQLIFLSVIKGDTHERRIGSQIGFERDFQDYTDEMIVKILEECGFSIKSIELASNKWIQVIATGA